MKISKLARLAKSNGQAVLYDTTGETKAVLLDEKYLKPFEEYKDWQLYYRRTESLEYVVGMDGLNIIGALLPYRLDKEKLAEDLSRLAMLISADE